MAQILKVTSHSMGHPASRGHHKTLGSPPIWVVRNRLHISWEPAASSVLRPWQAYSKTATMFIFADDFIEQSATIKSKKEGKGKEPIQSSSHIVSISNSTIPVVSVVSQDCASIVTTTFMVSSMVMSTSKPKSTPARAHTSTRTETVQEGEDHIAQLLGMDKDAGPFGTDQEVKTDHRQERPYLALELIQERYPKSTSTPARAHTSTRTETVQDIMPQVLGMDKDAGIGDRPPPRETLLCPDG